MIPTSEAGRPTVVAPAMKILLVEPAQTFAVHTEHPIVSAGCECVRVSSLEVAAAKLGTFRPLMILVDAAMLSAENSDGCSLLRAQEPNGDVPIVLIANPKTPTELIEASWRAGFDDCIVRPVRLVELQSRIAALREEVKPSANQPVQPASYRVLLIDSDVTFRERLGRLLELNGFHLLYAHSPDQAVMLLKNAPGKLDLVVSRSQEEAAKAVEVLQNIQSKTGLASLEALVVCEQAVAQMQAPATIKLHGVLDRGTEVPEALLRRIHPICYRVVRDIRAEERVPFFCPVEYREVGANSGWSSCFSYDMSPGGIFLRTLVPARPRASIDLKLHLPSMSEEISGTGVVAWSNPHASRRAFTYPVGMGIQFVGMSPKGLTQLRQLCSSVK